MSEICDNKPMGKKQTTFFHKSNLDIDDPNTTIHRKKVIQQKPFLQKIYMEWYSQIKSVFASIEGPLLELGSGPGFMSEIVDNLISSEVFHIPGVDLVLDGQTLPFKNSSLGGIAMTDVFHHIPSVKNFLAEASRCIKPGGILTMIEPWNTPWARFVFSNFHPEPFITDAKNWEFETSGPVSGANQALPWIVFERDREDFLRNFPDWQIHSIKPGMPLRYLLSGGVSRRNLVPHFSYPFWEKLENRLSPWMDNLAMFAQITLLHR